jgi:hypothetical protein
VRTQRWGKLCGSGLLIIALAASAAGCGDDGKDGSAASDRASAKASSHTDDQGTPKGKQSAVPDPLAPASIKPVMRNGKRPVPRLRATARPFDRTVAYSDGVRLRVTGVHQGRVTGTGPGVVRGPVTSFDLELSNGSDSSIDLNQVVPTAVYGSPARVSSPVYLSDEQDFRGVVKPGHNAKAVYRFSIPKASLGEVTFLVDFDGTHAAATFHGAAR